MDREDSQRPPTTNDILNLAIQATNNNAAVSVPDASNPADRRWLQEALAAACGGSQLDPVKRIISLIEFLKQPDLEESVVISSLDELLELTERMDYSNDFHKCGGFSVAQNLLASQHDDVRAKSAELFAQTMQNNPYCQEKVLAEPGLFQQFLNMMEHDSSYAVRSQALLAVSALISSNTVAQNEFRKLDGLSLLLRSMLETNSEKFQARTAFLLSKLCSKSQQFSSEMSDMGIVQHLFALLQQDHRQHHQHLMEALEVILKGSDTARRDFQQNSDFLRKRVEETRGLDEFREEYEAAGRILEILNRHTHAEMDAER